MDDDDDPSWEDPEAIQMDEVHSCDYSFNASSLDSIQAASDSLSTPCIAIYTLQALAEMLDVANANYTSVNDGYDAEFGYYVTYMKNLVPEVLSEQLMFNISATTQDNEFAVLGTGMNFFDCEISSSPDTTFPCADLGSHTKDLAEYETTLSLRDQAGYLNALNAAGIDQDWVSFGDYTLKRAPDLTYTSRTFSYNFKGFPVENSTMVVPNPKDIVTQGLGSMDDLSMSLTATLLDAMLANYVGGSLQDAAQAYSVPVFMYMQAIDNMAQAKALGEQEQETEEEEEKKREENLILLIIGVVLMFIPVVGDELAALTGIASLGRAIAIASEAGNAAVAIYDTIQDPSSALLNVLGMMFGVGSIAKVSRDGDGLAAVAKIRTTMRADVIASLGNIFKSNDDKLQSLMKVCKNPL